MSNQLYEMAQDIAASLLARKFPVEVIYGPERLVREGYFGYVVIVERARDVADQWLPTQGQASNPDSRGKRMLAFKVTIFAKSSVPNPTVWEHEEECDQLVDAWLTAQAEWGVAAKVGPTGIVVGAGRYLSAKDRDDVEQWAGAVYELQALLPRGVRNRDFTGAARPVGQATGVSNGVDVRQNANDDPERVPLP